MTKVIKGYINHVMGIASRMMSVEFPKISMAIRSINVWMTSMERKPKCPAAQYDDLKVAELSEMLEKIK